MTKEQYNSLAPYQKEVYDKWNKGNRMALFAGWILGAIVAIAWLRMMTSGMGSGSGFSDIVSVIFSAVIMGVVVGGFLPGLAHLGFLFKKIKLDTALLLIILLGIFVLFVYLFILVLIMYTGWIFFIIDTILFILKKPLIYRWEDKRVLAKALEQAVLYQDAVPSKNASSTADQLTELNQMLSNGLITQEEFDAKKAEILERM